jgi:N-acetylmuramoyl-L-alanine amidase
MYRIITLFGLVCLFAFSSAGAQALPRTSRLYSKNLVSNVPLAKPPMLQNNLLIVLDPGHGGHDVGTQSISKPRYQEKSLNLITAQFVRNYLKQAGFDVLMTREDDTFVSLEKRAQIANEKQPSLFVSIHYNSAPSADAQGIEVFYFLSKENKGRTLKSRRLAQAILKNVLKTTDANSRGVKSGNFLVIRETTVPAVLIEGGFVSNEEELQNLKNPDYLKKLAWGIAKGIEDYVNKWK